MVAFKHRVIGAGLRVFAATRLHKLAAPLTRGRGAILTFHRVRPATGGTFAPNRLLEITPDFLDAILGHLRRGGVDIVPLDAVPARLAEEDGAPFVALTFDDGYRDTLTEALPVLERHAAPFALFATTGFLDRTARLWWIELEEAIRALHQVRFGTPSGERLIDTKTARQKSHAFRTIRDALLAGDDADLLRAVDGLSQQAEIDPAALVARLCLTWDDLAQLAAHPLATIGCHTRTHPRLALLPAEEAECEMSGARQALETRLGRPVLHLAYPYGFRSAAGPREFDLARRIGFTTAVTTRPGILVESHAAHLTALPRLSVNGLWPNLGAVDALLSGLPTLLWNGGRRLDVL